MKVRTLRTVLRTISHLVSLDNVLASSIIMAVAQRSRVFHENDAVGFCPMMGLLIEGSSMILLNSSLNSFNLSR